MTTRRPRSEAQRAQQLSNLKAINERRRTTVLLKDGFTMHEIRGSRLSEIRFSNKGIREIRKRRREDMRPLLRRGLTPAEAARQIAISWSRTLADANIPGNRLLEIIYS